MDNINNFLIPNIAFDPSTALAGSQSQQFGAGIDQLGNVVQQAFGIEYQLPYAIRYDSPVAITSSSLANNVGVPNVVGNGTGAGNGSNNLQGPPGPPGTPGTNGTATPGGDDTNVQYNNAGTLDGSNNFFWLNGPSALDIEGKIQSQSDFTIHTIPQNPGSSPNLIIQTDDAQTTGALTEISGNLSIKTGFAFGDAGAIDIESGNSLNGNGGNIQILAKGSINGSSNGTVSVLAQGTNGTASAGQIEVIVTDASGTDQDGGLVLIRPGNGTGSGAFGSVNIEHGNFGVGGNAFNPSTPIIHLYDVNTPPATPSSGGIFYSSAGALHWLGSGGTDTVIAPA